MHTRTEPVTADPGVGTILFAVNINSLHAHRCLQETWGQVTSMYLNTRKQYEWLHFSEDCLYLNVYAPVLTPGDPLLPVSTLFSTTPFYYSTAQLRLWRPFLP